MAEDGPERVRRRSTARIWCRDGGGGGKRGGRLRGGGGGI